MFCLSTLVSLEFFYAITLPIENFQNLVTFAKFGNEKKLLNSEANELWVK